jgi:hypothetical protein
MAGDTSGSLQLQTNNGTTAVTIDTSQNVGIGTASPSAKLEITGVVKSGAGAGGAGGYKQNYSADSASRSWWLSADVNSYGDFCFQQSTTQTGSTYATKMMINPSGKVGIGTSSPAEQLSVAGSITATGVFIPTNGATTLGYIGNDNTITGGSGSNIGLRAENAMLFATNGATERMRIDSSGTPMFNCTAQLIRGGETFRANMGSGLASFYASTGGPTIAIKNATGVSTYQVAFNNSVGEVGTITTGSGSTAYNTSSDYRLKENIAPMTGALAKVQALKPVTYTWKSDGVDGEGFIAHELAEVCPQAVHGEKDAVNEDGTIKPQGIDTSFLVATLTAAIQEQQALITQLQADVAALKGVK